MELRVRAKIRLTALALCTLALFESHDVLAVTATANSYGIVSANSAAASTNTAILKQVASTFTGTLTFPDVAIYYFNDVIPFHDGVSLDLMGSTLSFSKVATSSDAGSGFVFAIRNYSISNSTIEVIYNGTGVSHSGNA